MSKREEMKSLISEYRNSGLSLKRFCTVHNESIHRVRYWIGKFNKESMDTSSFIPLNFPSGQAVGSEPVEIIYPNGIRIRIPHFDPHRISLLIQTCSCLR